MKNKNIIISVILAVVVIVLVLIFATGKGNSNPLATPMPTVQNQNIISHMDKQGVSIDVLQEGTGVEAKAGDTATVNYVGTLEDGTKFDSSIDRGVPFSFKLGASEVIKGWDIGVAGMKVGGKVRLTIPPELGYGANAYGPIPANSTLVFEVELLKIN